MVDLCRGGLDCEYTVNDLYRDRSMVNDLYREVSLVVPDLYRERCVSFAIGCRDRSLS